MNIDVTNNIYKDLKSYLVEKSKYNPTVVRKSLKQSDKFPLVVLTEYNNVFKTGTLHYKSREVIDSIYWEVNIYATDKVIDNSIISNSEICDELKYLIDNIMSKRYELTRISCSPTPNLDETIYRITMRYSADILVNKNRII